MMASRATLQAVTPESADVRPILNGLALLRSRLDNLIGEHDGIDLSFAPKGGALDLVIHAKVNSDPTRVAFRLETQPLEGAKFLNPLVKPDPKAAHRKIVVARIVEENYV